MTKDERDADRAICNAATVGPWGYKGGALKHYAFSLDEREDFGVSLQSLHWNDGHDVPAEANARFIAAARTRWPAALDALDEMDRRVAEVEALWARYDADANDLETQGVYTKAMEPRSHANVLDRALRILRGDS